MPLDGRAPYPHWPLPARPELLYPDGKRMAVYLGVNLEHFVLGHPSTSRSGVTAGLPVDPLNHGWRDYGLRVGFWRMLEAIDRNRLPVSVLINSEAARNYPDVVAAGRERGWAFLGHGRTNSELWTAMDEAEERSRLREIVETLTATTGAAPRGWLGPALSETERTLDLLAEHGFSYSLDWVADDQPFPLLVAGERRFASVPYSIELNDIPAFLDDSLAPDQFARMIVDQFTVLHDEARTRAGAVMCVALHPFLVGQPFRYKYLLEALTAISGHDDVWYANSDEIAQWYLDGPYDVAAAAVEAYRDEH